MDESCDFSQDVAVNRIPDVHDGKWVEYKDQRHVKWDE